MKSASLLIFLVLFTFDASRAAEKSGPIIKFSTKDSDIGTVEKGRMFSYLVEVKNYGTDDLVIENVYSSCGCFEVTDSRWPNNPHNAGPPPAIKPEPVTIKPNKSIFIATRLDTNKVSGQFEKTLHVVSNDPETKDAAWRIKGTVLDSASGVAERAQASSAPPASPDSKVVMLFYTPGCNECKEIKEKFLPGIKEKYKEKVLIVEYNIDNSESFAFLLDLQSKYDERFKKAFFNPKPPTVFVENKLLYGVKEIEKQLDIYLAGQ